MSSDPVVLDAFMCVCTPGARAVAETVMAEVCNRLECSPETLLTEVVISLNWDHSAHVTGIENDQWSGVYAEKYDKSLVTRVQCDLVEHGIAMTWKLFADHAEGKADDAIQAVIYADLVNREVTSREPMIPISEEPTE